jgi:fructose-1,6-bisphosphatase II / sedoheptulose-1,7-bisphosphatase
VLAAAALRSIGGQMQGRLVYRNDDERARATRWGITDFDRVYHLNDLASGDVMFAATGVTDGTMLAGVRRFPGGVTTHSIIMRSKTGTVRLIETEHYLQRKQAVVPQFAT